ncbi:MAG: cyclic nucleotide-binding domain-containing protein [Burkholderiales bacterium]|nr:cyclic nucleotide-binding domain-containing protein [Burkholderiales bacterium]
MAQGKTPAQSLFTSLSAGLIAGIRTILGSAAMVALILPGSLSGGVPQTLQALLLGGAVVGAVVALLSSYPGSVAQVQDGPAVILGVMATSISTSMEPTAAPELILAVVLTCAAVASVATGCVFWLLGRYRLGELVRFIPFPVIGGFLAGSGLLIFMGAFRVLTGVGIATVSWEALTEPMRMLRWVPGLILGFGMLAILRRFSHVLLVPAMLFGAMLVFYIAGWAIGIDMRLANASGLLLGPFPDSTGLSWPAWTMLSGEGWRMVSAQIPTFAAIVLVSVVALLLNASGLELGTRSDLDINRELRANGVANIAAGLVGGPVGYHALSASLLGARMGANSRLIGYVSALMCALVLVLGASLFAYVPKAVLGGLLVSMGAGMLIEWLWDGWRTLPRQDYMIVVLIVGVIGSVGILAGVAVGLAVAMAIFVLSYSRVRVIRQELTGIEYRSNVDRSPAALEVLRARGAAIHVLKLEGFVFFGTAYSLLTHVQDLLDPKRTQKVRYLVLDFRDVPASDSSAMSAFAKIVNYCERAGCELIFTRMKKAIVRQFKQAGIHTDGRAAFFSELDFALEYCEEKILSGDASSILPVDYSIWDRIAQALPAGVPMASFMAYLEPRTYNEGEHLMEQGGPPTEIIFIESGRVTVNLTFDDGRTIRLRSMTMGTMVGEIGLYLNQPRSASAVADHTTSAYILTREKLTEMEKRDPPLANALHYAIVALLAERLAGTNGLLQRLTG